MPSYKITADHPILKRADQIEPGRTEMTWAVSDLRERGFDNIKVTMLDVDNQPIVEPNPRDYVGWWWSYYPLSRCSSLGSWLCFSWSFYSSLDILDQGWRLFGWTHHNFDEAGYYKALEEYNDRRERAVQRTV